MFRIVLTCDGLPKDIGASAASDITEEFSHRPWHRNAECLWDGERLTFRADNEFDANGDALADEFSDAVVACTPGVGVSIAKVSIVKLDDMRPNKSLERTREG
jgi:hypothetical protein